jgi:hypothetical protein
MMNSKHNRKTNKKGNKENTKKINPIRLCIEDNNEKITKYLLKNYSTISDKEINCMHSSIVTNVTDNLINSLTLKMTKENINNNYINIETMDLSMISSYIDKCDKNKRYGVIVSYVRDSPNICRGMGHLYTKAVKFIQKIINNSCSNLLEINFWCYDNIVSIDNLPCTTIKICTPSFFDTKISYLPNSTKYLILRKQINVPIGYLNNSLNVLQLTINTNDNYSLRMMECAIIDVSNFNKIPVNIKKMTFNDYYNTKGLKPKFKLKYEIFENNFNLKFIVLKIRSEFSEHPHDFFLFHMDNCNYNYDKKNDFFIKEETE